VLSIIVLSRNIFRQANHNAFRTLSCNERARVIIERLSLSNLKKQPWMRCYRTEKTLPVGSRFEDKILTESILFLGLLEPLCHVLEDATIIRAMINLTCEMLEYLLVLLNIKFQLVSFLHYYLRLLCNNPNLIATEALSSGGIISFESPTPASCLYSLLTF
jgi:hypothetical protein